MADYTQIGGAFFEKTATGLSAISDQNILKQIQAGAIKVPKQTQITADLRFAPLPNPTAGDSLPLTPLPNPTVGFALPEFSNLNSSNLSTSTVPYVAPTPSSAPTIPPPSTDPFALSPEEQRVQTETERIQNLNEQLGGESAFRTQQEEQAGIPGLTKTQNELQQRVNILANEYKQAPLQVEQQFRGIGGVTQSTVTGKTNDELRRVAIASLGANSLLEASRGNLTLAQDMVERAVSAKFSPIREQIEIKTRNLELALKSPAYTNAEKKRAQAQLDAQNKKAADLQRQIDNEKSVLNIATVAAQNGADSKTLQLLQAARSPQEALQIAGYYLGAEFRAKLEDQKFSQDLQKANYNLSVQKFNEDTRQFGLNYALAQQKLAADQLADAAKANPEGTRIIKQTALESATELLRKFDAGQGTSALGKSAIFFTSAIPGTQAADFKVQFNNLKSLLSLSNVSLLKGQGQITEGEREMLSRASAKLELSQSESEFRSALSDIQTALQGDLGNNIFQQALNPVSPTNFYDSSTGYSIPSK